MMPTWGWMGREANEGSGECYALIRFEFICGKTSGAKSPACRRRGRSVNGITMQDKVIVTWQLVVQSGHLQQTPLPEAPMSRIPGHWHFKAETRSMALARTLAHI